jgi:hypothetical protein
LIRRFKNYVTRKKSWVQPFFNKSGHLGSPAVPTELDQESEGFRSFYTGRQGKVLNFALFLNNQDLFSQKMDCSPTSPTSFIIFASSLVLAYTSKAF